MTAAPTILDIDLAAIAANWRFLDAMHRGETAGVLKADAYGLGATQVAPALYAAGCKTFFTAHLSEALAVRHLVPAANFAVLHGIPPGEAATFTANAITPVLCSLADIALWRAEAVRLGKKLPALLHLGTGMSRLGVAPYDLQTLRENPSLLDGITITHVMTHLISAEAPNDETNAEQLTLFRERKTQFPVAKSSIANSSGMFLGADFTADLTRPGAALYGLNPTPGAKNPMQPVLRLTARILQVQTLETGETVGYNGTWTAARPSRIAVIAVGYADGFLRSLSNAATARFDEKPVSLVGRVSMDLSTFDITDTDAAAGDHLVLIGPGHDADALALEAGTNGYEILTSLGSRYQRRYSGATTSV
jgi:alanine racemase